MFSLLLAFAFSAEPKSIQLSFDYRDSNIQVIALEGERAEVSSASITDTSNDQLRLNLQSEVIDGDELVIDVELIEERSGKSIVSKAQVITFDQVEAEVELETSSGETIQYKITPRILK